MTWYQHDKCVWRISACQVCMTDISMPSVYDWISACQVSMTGYQHAKCVWLDISMTCVYDWKSAWHVCMTGYQHDKFVWLDISMTCVFDWISAWQVCITGYQHDKCVWLDISMTHVYDGYQHDACMTWYQHDKCVWLDISMTCVYNWISAWHMCITGYQHEVTYHSDGGGGEHLQGWQNTEVGNIGQQVHHDHDRHRDKDRQRQVPTKGEKCYNFTYNIQILSMTCFIYKKNCW